MVIFSPLAEFWREIPGKREIQTCFSLACVQPPALLQKNLEGGFFIEIIEIFLMSVGGSVHRLVSPWGNEKIEICQQLENVLETNCPY